MFSFLLIQNIIAKCPIEENKFPQLEVVPTLWDIQGVWLDQLSSRQVDTHFYCTQQTNTAYNSSSLRTDTLSSMAQGKIPYRAAFINNLHEQKYQEMVFDLIPDSPTAEPFANSLFFLIDYKKDNYYAWMICNESDEYEFHVSAKEGSDITNVDTKVLEILEEYSLNPKNYSFHQEVHDQDVCGTCFERGEECFRGDQCCSNRCTSLGGIFWSCA